MSGSLIAVVVTYRSAEEVTDCVRSLCDGGAVDTTVVVDNASGDGTVAAGRAAGAEILALPANLGFGAACNRGAALVAGADVFLLNPDARVRPGDIAILRAVLHAHPECGVVGPRVESPDGQYEPASRRSFPSPLVALYRLLGLHRFFPGSVRFSSYNLGGLDPGVPGEMDSCSGSAMLVRRAAWDAVGGFDEDYFMYGEELDLCRRIKDRGWTVRYEPAAVVVHSKGASSSKVPIRSLYHFHRSMWVYYRKHHRRGAAALLAPAVAAGIWTRFTGTMVMAVWPRVRPRHNRGRVPV